MELIPLRPMRQMRGFVKGIDGVPAIPTALSMTSAAASAKTPGNSPLTQRRKRTMLVGFPPWQERSHLHGRRQEVVLCFLTRSPASLPY